MQSAYLTLTSFCKELKNFLETLCIKSHAAERKGFKKVVVGRCIKIHVTEPGGMNGERGRKINIYWGVKGQIPQVKEKNRSTGRSTA
jgi:hypothetical protein